MSIVLPPALPGPGWDESEPPHWIDDEPDLPLAFEPFPPVRLPEAPEGVSEPVRDAVWQWRLAARRRMQAEAVEAAAAVQAEDVFRHEFAPGTSDADWFEDGGYKCFLADAADVMRCGTVTAARRLSDARFAMGRLPRTWALCA